MHTNTMHAKKSSQVPTIAKSVKSIIGWCGNNYESNKRWLNL